ncbi:hypothetical protein EBR21_00975 [bacterium]|nr:hypothetical protein [bacterium]
MTDSIFKMMRSIYVTVGVLASCGPTDQYIQKAKNTDASTADATTVLKSKNSVLSTVVSSGSSAANNGLSFSLAEVNIHQGMSSDVDVMVQGKTPNGALTVSQPSLAGLKIELLNSTGMPLTGPVTLDAQGNGKFKLRISSVVERTDQKITAPGASTGNLSLSASENGAALQGTVPVRVSNVAFVVMTGVTAVKQLPPLIEIPAGTIPVIVNPPSTAVAAILHFGGGGMGDAAFKHQSTAGSMPANGGYCPLNKDVKTIVTYGSGAVSANCLPCPETATADAEGTFYNHNGESSADARKLVCKKK